MGEREKNPMGYVIGGFSTAHRIQNCSTSRNPHLDSALDAPEFIPGCGVVGADKEMKNAHI